MLSGDGKSRPPCGIIPLSPNRPVLLQALLQKASDIRPLPTVSVLSLSQPRPLSTARGAPALVSWPLASRPQPVLSTTVRLVLLRCESQSMSPLCSELLKVSCHNKQQRHFQNLRFASLLLPHLPSDSHAGRLTGPPRPQDSSTAGLLHRLFPLPGTLFPLASVWFPQQPPRRGLNITFTGKPSSHTHPRTLLCFSS